MGASAAPTAFRAAEKAYQLHREEVTSSARGDSDGDAPARRRRGGARWRVRALDLSAVLDCGALAAEEAGAGSERPCDPPSPLGGCRLGARRIHAPSLPPHSAAYALDAHPGAFVVVGALSRAEQARRSAVACACSSPLTTAPQAEWAALCLRECVEAPATTNLGAALEAAPGACIMALFVLCATQLPPPHGPPDSR